VGKRPFASFDACSLTHAHTRTWICKHITCKEERDARVFMYWHTRTHTHEKHIHEHREVHTRTVIPYVHTRHENTEMLACGLTIQKGDASPGASLSRGPTQVRCK